MSLNRYINKSSLIALNRSSTGQLWTDEDLDIFDETILIPADPNIVVGQTSEIHIHSFYGDYILGNHDAGYAFHDFSSNSLLIDIGKVFKEANIQKGSYIIALNLFKQLWGKFGNEPFFVKEISPNRDEVHFQIDKKFIDEYPNIKEVIQSYINDGILNNLVINFGYNRIQKIINIRFDETGFFVKFYLPIDDEIVDKNRAWIQFEVVDPYIDTVVLAPPLIKGETQTIKGPNFNLDTGLYSSIGTDFQNWNQLLDANLTTQQRIIENSLSGSGMVQLNIDFTDFNNFVFYSSAEERVRNFHYKVSKIEEYSSSIEILNNSTASNTVFISSSVDINRKRINEITSNFDPWEKWLYFESTASIFTHDITGSIAPYPKRLVSGNWKNYTISSSIAQTWYNTLLVSSSQYDQQNMNRLWWAIPEHIIMEPGNSDFVLFVDLIGHHFDILYGYVNALTQIHERDEHPKRGTPNELLFSIAKSFGWELQNSRSIEALWKYKLGQNQEGIFENSGSMFSLAAENQTHQIWRRIVNNLPYLYKTKGTLRSIKALMSIYGIPQTLISVKEFGGPSTKEISPVWIQDRFHYALNFTGSQYITMDRWPIPTSSGSWDGLDRPTDTIEFRFRTNYSSSVSMSLMSIADGNYLSFNQYYPKFEIGIIHPQQRISGSYTYGKVQISIIDYNVDSSFGINRVITSSYLPIYDNDFWTIRAWPDAPMADDNPLVDFNVQIARASDSLFGRIAHSQSLDITPDFGFDYMWSQRISTHTDKIFLGGGTQSLDVDGNYYDQNRFVGQIQGYKEYFTTYSDEVFNSHVLNPAAYHTNDISGSYNYLHRYYPLGLDNQRFDHSVYTQVSSSHPNQRSSTYTTASFFNFTGSQVQQYKSSVETYYIDTPTIGGNLIRSEKIRFEDNIQLKDLNSFSKSTKGSFDNSTFDTNRLAVVFSPTDQVDFDIFNHMGKVEIDDYIGSPQNQFKDEYNELRQLRDSYFKKYQQRYDANALIRLLALYDYTFFEQIKQLIPARADLIAGVLLEGDFLSTPKVQLTKKPEVKNLTYNAEIFQISPTGSGENSYWETSASFTPRLESKYKYYTASLQQEVNLKGFSLHQTSSKGGYKCELPIIENPYSGSQSPTQSYIDGRRLNCCYQKVIFHYSGAGQFISRYEKNWYAAVSQSYGWHYSRSLQCTDYQYDEGCNSVENLSRFAGTKITGPGINIPSNYTLNKGPVIEVWEVNPNQVIIKDSPNGGRLYIE